MHLFGYFDAKDGFNAVEFAAENYKGFLAAIAPDVDPHIVFATSSDAEEEIDDDPDKDRLLPFTGIYETEVEIVTPSGEQHHFPWAMSIDVIRGEEIDAAFLRANLEESINIVWQLYGCIFRDIRMTLFLHHKVTDLLSPDTLTDIALYSPPVAKIVSFSLEKDRAIAPHHVDATLVGRISSLRWLHEVTENDEETFSDQEIRRLLLVTQRSFSRNPDQWIGFLDGHDTIM